MRTLVDQEGRLHNLKFPVQIMERLQPPDSVFILLASIIHLMAMLISSFLRWYDFVVENQDVIDDAQFDLFCHHLTHTLAFVSLLWCLFLGVIGMSLPQDLSCRHQAARTICVTLFCPRRLPGRRCRFFRPVCVTLFTLVVFQGCPF